MANNNIQNKKFEKIVADVKNNRVLRNNYHPVCKRAPCTCIQRYRVCRRVMICVTTGTSVYDLVPGRTNVRVDATGRCIRRTAVYRRHSGTLVLRVNGVRSVAEIRSIEKTKKKKNTN